MDKLQIALSQLAENVGGFDNIKFLLSGAEGGMSREHVTDHLDLINAGLASGEIRPASLNEESLSAAIFPM